MRRIAAASACLLLLSACGGAEVPSVDPSEKPQAQIVAPEPEDTDSLPTSAGESVPERYTSDEINRLLLSGGEPYTPENNMVPDTVSADTMGDVLCDETLPGGLRVVCYWEPEGDGAKYWAVRQDDTLLRFCIEENDYNGGYDAEPFSDVLGQSGFRIIAPRGAAYTAYDYYALDGEGVPRLLAACANWVEETDINQDGETDLRWFYHGGREAFAFFRQDGCLYESELYNANFDIVPLVGAGGS